MKIKALEELASKLVGDGKKPNVFFCTRRGRVVATFVKRAEAVDYLFRGQCDTVEDRLTGVIEGR